MRIQGRFVFWAVVLGGFGVCLAAPWQQPPPRKTTDPPVPARGKMGQDLFLAIDHRDLAGVQALLKQGADPNSRNGLEFTPLAIAAASHQADIMQALLAGGAEPEAVSAYGTPLTFAAETGNLEGAELLFAKGANVNTARGDGTTVLMMASLAGNPPLVAELLKRGAKVDAKNDSGANALTYAARAGNTPVVDILLGAGAPVDAADGDGLTPLMFAAMNGHTDVVKMLLGHGAKVDARSAKGQTALILTSASGDHPDVVKALTDGGADALAADNKGRTASAYAQARGYVAIGGLLPKATDAALKAVGTVRDPREAITSSLRILQSSMQTFCDNAACVSCHQEGLGRMTTGLARDRGFAVSDEIAKLQLQRLNGGLDALKPLCQAAVKDPEAMKQVPLIEINEVATGDTWLLCGMAAQHEPATDSTEATAVVLAKQQAADGHWSFSLPRIPMQSSFFTFTAMSVRALQAYAPKEAAARSALAREWLIKTPATPAIDDLSFKLLGLKWTGASMADRQPAIEALRAAQRPDGGWAQVPGLQSDAYATGQALYALHEGGEVKVSDPLYKKGVQFLLRNQDADGSWFVNKRAFPANNYFDAGFPHGESQFASFNGTCWATMALLETTKGK